MLDISVIILTFNEEIHIERCICNAKKFAKEIFIVDSFSTDRTVEIAERLGAKVYQHPWKYPANQFNWALNNLPIKTEWIWKQDADEWLTDELIQELHDKIPQCPDNTNAYTAPCLRMFMGKEIKHGIIPLILLRLFRFRYGSVEDKMMDEHVMISEGDIANLTHAFYDDNLNGLTWWTQKHNNYATKEALELLKTEYGLSKQNVVKSGEHSETVRKRKLKYVKMPLFWRAFAFFFLRYILRGGFLDGKEGFLWHFLQGFWYRALADAKVFEFKKRCDWDDEKIKAEIRERFLQKSDLGGYM